MIEIINLIKEAKKGNRRAFGEIYNLYFVKIFRYTKFNINDETEAEDITQETFVKAWKNIEKFDVERENWSIQAFLFTIARNLIIDRSRKKKELHLEEYLEIESTENIYESIERKNNIDLIKSALSKLEETDRQIIILRFFEEMETREIANILGINDGALRVRLHRAMDKLRIVVEGINGKRN
jgi:RNA polymerase sigma-70 factor, ECF subfamily